MQIFNPMEKLVIPIEITTIKAKGEIETHSVIAAVTIRRRSI